MRRPERRAAGGAVAAAAAVVTTAAMIATPLARRAGSTRRVLASVVVGGMFATTTANAARRWSAGRALSAAGTVAAATTTVERVGTATGLPFGRYSYTGTLRPAVGDVPVIVPLAWFAMALPSREAADAALGGRSTPARRVLIGATAMTAWDLFLDPQMVGEGYWRWVRRGRYRGIPVSNFVGWWITSAAIMALLERQLPPREPAAHGAIGDLDGRSEPADPALGADPALVSEYVFVSVMQTLGFARFFGDRVVAAVGGAGMLPIAAAATAGLIRRGRP